MAPTPRRRLAHNLRRLRREAGLTIQEAAARAGIRSARWRQIEAAEANVTLRTVVVLANAFEVSCADLFLPPPRRLKRP